MATEPEEIQGEFSSLLSVTGWVVHEVSLTNAEQTRHGSVWAWCRVQHDEPGYSEVAFTKADGFTQAQKPDGDLRLGKVLFQVWC
jgi:hypothetical protein